MPKATNLERHATQVAIEPSTIPQTCKKTKQVSPLSSNGLTFTYNGQEENPVYGRVGFVRKNSIIHTIQGQPAPLVSPAFKPDIDNIDTDIRSRVAKALAIASYFKETNDGLMVNPVLGAPQKEIDEAVSENRLCEEDGTELRGDRGLGEALSRTQQAGKPVYRLDGSVVEKNFTFRELSEADQKLLKNSVLVYLIYLRSLEDLNNKKDTESTENFTNLQGDFENKIPTTSNREVVCYVSKYEFDSDLRDLKLKSAEKAHELIRWMLGEVVRNQGKEEREKLRDEKFRDLKQYNFKVIDEKILSEKLGDQELIKKVQDTSSKLKQFTFGIHVILKGAEINKSSSGTISTAA